jgi:2,3-bisphosphoglycerate-dependent phosphoglycerate mutase
MGKLVLVRHGQSQWNLENKFTGWVDVELTPAGMAEAKKAGEKLKDIKFDEAYTSELKRAQKTLEIILQESKQEKIPVTKDKALNERHYGDLQGLDKAETAKKFGDDQVKIWRRSYDIAPPNGESLKDTAARTLPYFNNTILPKVKKSETIIIAAHGNSLRSIVMELDKLTKEQVLELNIGTGQPIVYEIDAAGKVVKKTSL